jgi:uncharacterized phosphosugar-binding protein
MFPRYGSYPGFNPIVELSMTFTPQVVGANGQRQAMFIERVEGLAERSSRTSSCADRRDDGLQRERVTAVPIEMALGARARGLKVIAVTSIASRRRASHGTAQAACSTTPTSCSTSRRRPATR